MIFSPLRNMLPNCKGNLLRLSKKYTKCPIPSSSGKEESFVANDKIRRILKVHFPVIFGFLKYSRSKVIRFLIRRQRQQLPQLIRDYYEMSTDNEITGILSYLKRTNQVQMISYDFREKYEKQKITIIRDEKCNYPYVIIGEHKVYFPDKSDSEIRGAVINAMIEQDDRSPHRYLTEKFAIDDGDTAILIGASDGIFGLRIVDKVKKMYLFEPDTQWIAPLNLTFQPWLHKIHIINKYVGDVDGSSVVTLDSFVSSLEEEVNYIQADVEGREKELLLSGLKTLESSSKLKLSLCCYHNQKDKKELSEILCAKGYEISYSYGYMLMWMQYPCKPPYLRKGVMYAQTS